MTRILLVLLVLAGVAPIGCGSDPTAPKPPVDSVLPPDPDGMPLPGDDGADALAAVVSLAPSPVPPQEVRNGLLTTRIRAVLAPGTTVGEVNRTLERENAAIVSMRAGFPTVILVVEAAADEAEAAARARSLADSDAFLAAFPGRTFGQHSPPVATAPGVTAAAELPGGWTADEPPPFDYFEQMTVPQTWPLRTVHRDEVVVVLADEFTDVAEHEEISGLTEPDNVAGLRAFDDLTTDGSRYLGNRGYHHAGVIGASWEGSSLLGVHPDVTIIGFPIGGLDMSEILHELGFELYARTGPMVLVTPFGFSYEPTPPIPQESAMLAAEWLSLVRVLGLESRVLHVAGAGDTGEGSEVYRVSHTTSPWNLAASYASLATYLEENLATEPDIAEFVEFEQLLRIGIDYSTAPLDNVIIVGASDAFGEPLPTSSLLPHVLAPGVRISGPCAQADPGIGGDPTLCDGARAEYSGTGPAAALVGGVASFLWDMAPGRAPGEIREAILFGYAEGFEFGAVDAYRAALALDPGLNDPVVREALLDVTGDEDDFPDLDAPNGIFDEKDLKVFLDRFAAVQGTPRFLDDLRFDLNGDGLVSSLTVARFDLDADRPPAFETVTIDAGGTEESFDERAVTDQDILCYYAYSDLYLGDEGLRDILLSDCGNRSGLFVEVLDVPTRVSAGETVEIRVRAGFNDGDGGVSYAEGVQISIEGDGIEAVPDDGPTDALGVFRTTITFGDDYNRMVVGAWADSDDEEVYSEQTALRRNEIEVVSSYAFAYVDLLASYQTEAGIPSTRIIFEGLIHDVDGFALVDTSMGADRTAQGAGMTATGSASVDASAEMSGDGAELSVVYTSRFEASIRLENPNFDLLNYFARADAGFELDVEFIVWGDPAEYSLSGFVDAGDYEVQLDGPDDDVFLCDPGDSPCAAPNAAGTLPPGTYEWSLYSGSDVRIRWFEDCTDCTTSGTRTSDGAMSVSLDVRHPGATP